MHTIYGGAALTIAAPICEEATQSFIDQRQFKPWFPVALFESNFPNQMAGPSPCTWIYGSRVRKGFMWVLEKSWETVLRDNSSLDNWMTRAWTLQEWMFSPKIVHINKMTWWDCLEAYGDEVTQRELAPATLGRTSFGHAGSLEWEQLVEHYTTRKITRDKDRLPALAGMARLYEHYLGKTYIAGAVAARFTRMSQLEEGTELQQQT
jgi:hypothetical protein